MTTFSTSTRLSRGLGFRRRAGFRSGSGSFGTGGRTRALTGIAGSVVASYVGQALGLYTAGEGAGFIGAVVGAIALLVVYGLVKDKSGQA